MDFSKIKTIYMIGIKGVGMTMLAQFLVEKGFTVSGSDTDEVFMTNQVLKSSGIEVIEGFNKDNIKNNVDLIIYSTAYRIDTNVELAEAFKKNKKVVTFPEVLKSFFNQYYGVAVTGTHGKTTVTAWLGYVMMKSGLNPNVLVGSRVKQFNGSSITGPSRYLVLEADEYQNKLQYYNPKVVLLNNIDHDHHDFFKTKEDYLKVFVDFITRISKKGFLVANFDDENIRSIVDNCKCNIISYGIDNDADLIATDIKQHKDYQTFQVSIRGDKERDDLGLFSIRLSGKHNVYNALAVITTSIELDIELADIRSNLEDFKGTARRAELMGEFNGVKIIDDYAHHPTEIKTTLRGIKDANKKKNIKVVFHPHLFSRTINLLDEFAESFEIADEVVVLDIYSSARETSGGVHSLDLIEKIKKYNEVNGIVQNVVYKPTLDDAENYLRETVVGGDIVILMGAGDIFRIGENLIEK